MFHNFGHRRPLGEWTVWGDHRPDQALGDELGFHGRKSSAVNYVGDARVYVLTGAVEAVSRHHDQSFVALYYPFLDVIPLESLGVTPDLVELSNPDVHDRIVDGVARASAASSAGSERKVAPASSLPDSVTRCDLAVCFRAALNPHDYNRMLDLFVELAAFVPDADLWFGEASPEVRERVKHAELARIRWLRVSDTPELTVTLEQPISMGGHFTSEAAKKSDFYMTLLIAAAVPEWIGFGLGFVAGRGFLFFLLIVGAGASGFLPATFYPKFIERRTSNPSIIRWLIRAACVVFAVATPVLLWLFIFRAAGSS